MKETKFSSYTVIGSGRLARHLQYYLKTLNLPFQTWSRRANSPNQLKQVTEASSHLLFAISESAIEAVSAPWHDSDKVLVHFSGALQSRFVRGAHPLMAFGPEIEPPGWYRVIPFVVDEGVRLPEVLPGLPNAFWPLPIAQRPLYHAMCSLAGNASFLLWQNIGEEFERLGLPRHLLTQFLHQVVVNAGKADPNAFTGPVSRQDWPTVASHLEALRSKPLLLEVYRQYLNMARNSGHPVPEDLK